MCHVPHTAALALHGLPCIELAAPLWCRMLWSHWSVSGGDPLTALLSVLVVQILMMLSLQGGTYNGATDSDRQTSKRAGAARPKVHLHTTGEPMASCRWLQPG